MTTQVPPSYEEALAEAKRLLAKPLSSEERIEYAKGAIEVLQDDEEIAKFERDIENVAKAAIQIDAAFDRVTRGFQDMVDKHGHDFPGLYIYKNDWDGYNERWVQYLWDSRHVASEMAAVLRRYDQVFLDLIQSIETDQDRRDVIKELANFSNESHAEAALMATNFRNLEADVRGFDKRFSTYLEQQGVKLAEEAKVLQEQIDALKDEIKSYNEMILAALGLMAAGLGLMGAGLPIIGFVTFVIAGSAAAAFLVLRISDEKKLEKKQAELRVVNEKQQALAELKTQFDILKPDIALIADQLVLFGDIWDSVSLQCTAFGKHLEKGMDALDDEEFQLHVTLAKKTCTPLRRGLDKYAEAIIASPLQSKALRLGSK